MPLIAWTNQMNVGVKLLNNDHKMLMNLINNLHDGLVTGRTKPDLEDTFERLIAFTRLHHAHEEKFLAEAGYHDFQMHEQEHGQMVEQLLELQIQFTSTAQLGAEMEIVQQLRVWLFKHIQGADQQFIPHLKTINVEAILAGWKTPLEFPRMRHASEPIIEQGVR